MPPQQQQPYDPNAPMTPEQKQELLQKLEAVKQGYSKWTSMRFALQNKSDEARRDQLRRVFQVLQSQGINLNDPKSVSGLLNQLKMQSPEQYEAITRALDYLLSNENVQSSRPAAGVPAPQQQPA